MKTKRNTRVRREYLQHGKVTDPPLTIIAFGPPELFIKQLYPDIKQEAPCESVREEAITANAKHEGQS